MRKLTRGYILLTLLVLTGFAGQVSNQTISSKERTELVSSLKQAKKALLISVDDLTTEQLSFKPSKAEQSISEKILELNAAQTLLLSNVDATINGTAIGLANTSAPTFSTANIAADNVIDQFKASQSRLVKYARTTTEDMHSYQVQTASGRKDAYQALLELPALSKKCITEIEAVKKHPRFPK